MNYGFIPDVPNEEDYKLGSLPQPVLVPDINWSPWLPLREIQLRKIDPCNCTAFGSINLIKMYQKRVFNIFQDYSERALGIVSGTRPPGNSPAVVLDKIRHVGLVPDEDLSYTDEILTINQYYSPDPLTYLLRRRAKEWTRKWDFQYEWVFHDGSVAEKYAKLKDALQYSPVGVSVYAWIQEGDYYKKPIGADDNHWTTVFHVDSENRAHIWDSYDNTIKVTVPFYDFGQARRIHIEKKNPPKGLMGIIRNYISDLLL
jgi:hypothetical protein